MKQLADLARPFPASLIEKKPGRGGGDYVTHSVVNERLLQAVGPFSLELVEVVRGDAPEAKTKNKTYPARANAIVGVVARLTVTVDGRQVSIEEVGAEDNPAMQNDAENLKNAMSDALKRCAMRLGLGLHLWSQEHYFLDRALAKDAANDEAPTEGGEKQQAAKPAKSAPAKAVTKGDDLPISADAAARLMESLTELGVPADEHLQFASDVTGREIEALSELTRAEAKRVHATANGEAAA